MPRDAQPDKPRIACLLVPDLLVGAELYAARHTLRDVALSVSPRVEMTPRGSGIYAAEAAVHLDASGTRHLFPSEAGLAGALVARAEKLGLPAVVALASSRGVAHLAARCLARRGTGAVEIISSGADAAFLAPLPLDLLASQDDLVLALARLGIRRLGELARLPSRSLATRFGATVLRLQALARGQPRERPIAPVHDPRIEEAIDLDFSLDRLEPLSFVLRGLLSRLLARLELRGLACAELELSLGMEGGGTDDRHLGLAAPTLDERVLLRRILLALESRPPDAAIDRVSIGLTGRPSRHDQLDFFRPAGPSPARLEELLAELEALCGEGKVGAPCVRDDWRPEAYGVLPFAPSHNFAASQKGPKRPDLDPEARPALRALRPPLPAQVRISQGRPERVRSALANGRILRAAGPWRTTGAWWSPTHRFAYDHFDIETEDGLVTRLRFDRIAGRWHVDAVYD